MSIRLTIKVDADRTKRDLEKLADKVMHSTELAMVRACELVRGFVVANKLHGSPLRWRSGNLAGSIQSHTKRERDGVRGFVGSNLVYARIHELGGVIRPKRAKFLVFEIDGQKIFAKKVVMPKRPYLKPSVIEAKDLIVETLAEGFMEGLKR